MDETGQPGAATPGEHGDGTGQQDDLAHSTSAWAPSGAGWSRAADGGFRGEPTRTQWRPSDPGHGWASSSPQHGDLPAPMPGVDEVSELPSRVNGRRLNGHVHRDDSPGGRQVPVSAPPGPAGDPDHGRLAVPAQRPSPALEQTGEPSREAAALRHPTGGQPVLPSDGAAVRHPTGGHPVVEAGGATTHPAVDPGTLRHPTGAHPTLSAEGRPARHASDEPSPPPPPADHRAEGSRPTSTPPAQSSAPDAERRPWNTPTEPERPSWAGGGWAPPWSQEGGGGRRSRAERHREDDEPTGRRFREERSPEDVPPTWAPPSDAREPESRRLPDAVRAPSTDSAVPRSPSTEPLPGRAPRPEPAPDRTPTAEAGTPYRVAESGDARVPSGEAAPYRAAGRRSYEPEAEPRRPYPPVDPNTWAGRPTPAPSSAPPVPSPAEPTEPSGVRPEARAVRPFRLRPEAAEADHPPSAGHHPDRAGAGRLAAPATGAAGRVDQTPPAPAPAGAPRTRPVDPRPNRCPRLRPPSPTGIRAARRRCCPSAYPPSRMCPSCRSRQPWIPPPRPPNWPASPPT